MRQLLKYILLLLIAGSNPFSLFSQQTQGEYSLLRSLAAKRTNAGNTFHKRFAELNRPVCLAVPAGLFITGLLEKDKTLKENALFITESILVSSLSTWTLKKIVRRERPAVNDPSFVAVTDDHDFSFPSGHTSLAFSMATSLSIKYRKWYIVVPAFLYAGFNGYSRLYLGVHYPTDVLAGAITGSSSAWLTFKLNQWLHRKKKNKAAAAL